MANWKLWFFFGIQILELPNVLGPPWPPRSLRSGFAKFDVHSFPGTVPSESSNLCCSNYANCVGHWSGAPGCTQLRNTRLENPATSSFCSNCDRSLFFTSGNYSQENNHTHHKRKSCLPCLQIFKCRVGQNIRRIRNSKKRSSFRDLHKNMKIKQYLLK